MPSCPLLLCVLLSGVHACMQSIAQPGEFLMTDFSKFDRPALLHIAFHALDIFEVRRRQGGPTWPWLCGQACIHVPAVAVSMAPVCVC